jgi:class 3 adenylate cyclase
MFTDIVGSTEACSRYGDDAAMAMLNLHDTTVRAALADHDGREVKHTGDGIMAAFLSSAGAVRSACQIQQTLAKRSETESDMFAVTLRIGISAGEPVDHHDDLFGSAVQLASRLCARAEPGQILVSTVVADLCLGKGLKFRDAGETMLKGFDAPVATRAVELCC